MFIKKFKVLAVFIVGIIFVFTIIFFYNFFKTNAAHGDTLQNLSVYDDQLSSQFANWSWNSSVNFSNTSPVNAGSSSISFTPAAWGGLYLHANTAINPASYTSLQFAMQTADQEKNFTLLFYDANNQVMKSIPLTQYPGADQNGWKMYTIPMSEVSQPIGGFALQETSGSDGPVVYMDAIQFVTNQSAPTAPVASESAAPTPTGDPAPTAATVAPVSAANTTGNPLAGATFFNNPDVNPAKQQEQQWESSRPDDAAQIAKIADQPKAMWIGSWNANVQADVQTVVSKAAAAGSVPVFVSYNIPNRDCGGYSAGGSGSTETYTSWISSFAQGIGNNRAVVILEPDALAQVTCLSADDQAQRYSMLTNAVQTFKSLGNTAVYIDAGHSGWISASDMANRLNQAGIAKADGFALNVSNFMTSSDSIAYGSELAGLVANKHFVIDTSRNGNGPTGDNAWCNPPGRALGDKPTTQTGNALVDAYLWVKSPGESDGNCNGGPNAGAWFADYALGLAQRARW